jgi:hypothetical protein
VKTRYFRKKCPFLSAKLHGDATLNRLILKYLRCFVVELQQSHFLRSARAKRPEREADHLSPSNAEIKIRGAIPPPPYDCMTWCLVVPQGQLYHFYLHLLIDSQFIYRRRMRWAGHVARIGELRGAYNILVGRPEGRRPLGRPRRRWEDNTKMDLREIGFGDVDWMHLAQDRNRWRALVNTVMNLRVP